jgi:hypothetical protein
MQHWVLIGILSWCTLSLLVCMMMARVFMVMSDVHGEAGVESGARVADIFKTVVKSQPGVMRLKSFLQSAHVIG